MLSSSPEKREPVFNLPLIMTFLVGVLVGLHLWAGYGMDSWGRIELIWDFSFIPVEFHNFHITRDPKFSGFAAIMFTYLNPYNWADIGVQWFRLMSYSFLHADFVHLGFNLVWLVIFGSPLSYHLGTMRFVVFWVMMAVLSALTHFVIDPTSPVPMIGASGVVSALMGAAVRYNFYRSPHARLLTMKQALINKTGLSFVGIWLIFNLAVGLGIHIPGMDDINIAWAAHIGGLVAGFVLIGLFDSKKRA